MGFFALWFLTLLWACAVTALLIRNPLPFPDRGHRLFSVPDDRARQTVTTLLTRAGLKPRLRFRIGPSDQTVFSDNATVIHCFTATSGANGNGMSLVVSEPTAAAAAAIKDLRAHSFAAHQLPPFQMKLPPDHMTISTSAAFPHCARKIRRHN